MSPLSSSVADSRLCTPAAELLALLHVPHDCTPLPALPQQRVTCSNPIVFLLLQVFIFVKLTCSALFFVTCVII